MCSSVGEMLWGFFRFLNWRHLNVSEIIVRNFKFVRISIADFYFFVRIFLALFNYIFKFILKIDASQNELTQLQQFLQLIQTLKKLNLADNRINSIGCLDTFVNLQWLNFSHNRIEVFFFFLIFYFFFKFQNLPKLDQLHNLSTLILNCNRLRAIPNLSKLEALTELGLHGNLVRI